MVCSRKNYDYLLQGWISRAFNLLMCIIFSFLKSDEAKGCSMLRWIAKTNYQLTRFPTNEWLTGHQTNLWHMEATRKKQIQSYEVGSSKIWNDQYVKWTYNAACWILNLIDEGFSSGLLTLCSHSRHLCERLVLKCLYDGNKSLMSSGCISGWANRWVKVVTVNSKRNQHWTIQ